VVGVELNTPKYGHTAAGQLYAARVPQNRNLFSIGRHRGDEDQLTEMVVWLVEAVPSVGQALVQLCFGPDAVIDATTLEVTTQQPVGVGYLDAFIEAPPYEVVVESKLGAAYGEGQIRKYAEWLRSRQSTNRQGLLTLTARRAPWPDGDAELTESYGIVAAPRRWEELHLALQPLIEQASSDSVEAKLMTDFLDMLRDESLVPVSRLSRVEMEDLWSRSVAVERRFHEFFRACIPALAEALGASPHPNRGSNAVGFAYQDFVTQDDALITVAFSSSDREMPLKAHLYRDLPIVWLAYLAEHRADWDQVRSRLEASPPDGWHSNAKRWYGRPQVWRYMNEVVQGEAFDEQAAALATACTAAVRWADAACQLVGRVSD
jgi:hypothetical protein